MKFLLKAISKVFKAKPASLATLTYLPIKVETVSREELRMTAKAVRNEKGILVSGNVARNPRFAIPEGSHLHVVAINSKGVRVADEPVRCDLSKLRSTRHGYKAAPLWYAFQLPADPSDLVKIRVVYHSHGHSHCSRGGCK